MIQLLGAANRALRKNREELATEKTKRQDEARLALIGTPKDASSYRNALEQAAKSEALADFTRLLNRASSVGDEEGGRAVVTIALERGYPGILDAYAEAFPNRSSAVTSYRSAMAVEGNLQERMATRMHLGGMELPAELKDISGPERASAEGQG